MPNRRRFLRVLSKSAAVVYNPLAQAWFDAYDAQPGDPFPESYKILYSDLIDNWQGKGTKGPYDVLTSYKVAKGLTGYFNGSKKWSLLSDLLNPSSPPMTEINGGGNYVQIGSDPNIYTRQAAGLKAWNTEEIPSLHSFITTSKAGYGSWLLTDIAADNSLYLIGCSNASFTSQLGIQARTSNQTIYVINGTLYTGAVTTGTKGYYEIHRTASFGAGCTQLYLNSSQIVTGSNASIAVPDTKIIDNGFSYDNGASISQTVTGGETPNTGVFVMFDRSTWTPAIGAQFYNSLVQFYTDAGITL